MYPMWCINSILDPRALSLFVNKDQKGNQFAFQVVSVHTIEEQDGVEARHRIESLQR